MMSGPELPHKISSSEETLACLRSITNDLREMRLGLNKRTSKKAVASSDLAPDPSAGLDSGGVISQGFRGPFLLNSSCHDQLPLQNRDRLSDQEPDQMMQHSS